MCPVRLTYLVEHSLFAPKKEVSGKFMGIVVQIFYTYALAIGALFICIFVGWRWGVPSARRELTAEGVAFPGLGLWGLLIKFVCPVVVGIIVVKRIIDLF